MFDPKKILLLSLLLLAPFAVAAKEVINAKIPIDVRINPLLILADYDLGACSIPKPGEKDRRNPDNPYYQRCMNFPLILAEQLRERGFDVKLESFKPSEPMTRDDYWAARQSWRAEQEKQHPDRYVLTYGGLLEDMTNSLALLMLQSPVDNGGIALGSIRLDQKYSTSINNRKLMVPLPQVTMIVVNTLEARCPSVGLWSGCSERTVLMESSN